MAKTNVRKGAVKATQAASAARSNPYVRRFLEDDELRQNVIDAVAAVRNAYRRMSNGKGPARALAEDKKVQQNLRQAAESLRAASEQLRAKPKRRRKGGLGRVLLLIVVSGGVVLAVSEGARKVVLDLIFGSEEEFEYTSSTTTSTS